MVFLGLDGRVAPRSGLAAKHSIDVGAGVIDADYRGEVKVLLFNFSDQDFSIAAGDRVAQLVLERVSPVRLRRLLVVCVDADWVINRFVHRRLALWRNWRRVFAELAGLEARAIELIMRYYVRTAMNDEVYRSSIYLSMSIED